MRLRHLVFLACAAGQPSLIWRVRIIGDGGMKSDGILLPVGLQAKQLIIGANDGYVYSFDATNGTQRWALKTGGPVYAGATAAPDGMRLYIGSGDGRELALQASNGEELWSFATGGFVGSNPTLSRDGRVLYTGSADRVVYALDTSGANPPALLWKADVSGVVASYSVLSPDESALYVGVHDGSVLKLSTTHGGELLWNFTATPGVQVQSDQALSRDGAVLYIGSDDGECLSHELATHSQMERTLVCSPVDARRGRPSLCARYSDRPPSLELRSGGGCAVGHHAGRGRGKSLLWLL